ncbi:GNAT family N-acetyltransferase [Streptomyces sp. NPDC048442]|uniref:GNAT family N-acetyltransferase n=1 Tax=Streptomyces sp. NPDC048442 TaxID=3154823 RepID=UPI0034441EA7
MMRTVRVRQAVADDIPELVRLRALLFEDLGGEFFNPSSADGDWRHSLAAVLKEQMVSDTVRILVVDGEYPYADADADADAVDRTGGPLAACAIGTIEQRLPGPHLRNGRTGQVLGVVTDPEHRRRGHSRALMQGLLNWFREREAARVDLYASAEGEPLYRALGFDDLPDPALYWRP